MPASKVIVTLAGFIAIVWVLWYFLLVPTPDARRPTSGT